jgi:protein-tyrosine phosphatase
VRTVIDLRNDDERSPDVAPRPASITTLLLPLDGTADAAFWAEWGSGPQIGTPLYYGAFLERFPDRTAAVVAAVARAQPGGVLLHCRIGRDRAGLAAMLLLALADVAPEEIADDHGLSHERVRVLLAAIGEPDQETGITAELERRGTTAREAILDLLSAFDAESYLREAGLTDADVAALRARMLG